MDDYFQFLKIWNEIVTIRDTEKLAEIAAEQKPSMLLLPYGIRSRLARSPISRSTGCSYEFSAETPLSGVRYASDDRDTADQ